MIGRAPRFMCNGSSSQDASEWAGPLLGFGGGQSSSGYSEVFEYIVQPSEFSRLASPSPATGWRSDSIVVQSGAAFAGTGRIWMPVTFHPEPVESAPRRAAAR